MTSQAELKSFVLDIENELADYDAYVARVTRVLAEKRQAGELFLAQHKRLLIHIHACPPEIMLEIFLHCLDWDVPEASHGRPSYSLQAPEIPVPWVLSAVCRRWRNILRESPSYWTSFTVGSQLKFLEDALQLSKQAPLYPILDLGDCDRDGSPSSCIEALLEHTSRWKTLNVYGSGDGFDGFEEIGNLPILTGLRVSLEATYDPDDHELFDYEEIMDISAAMAPFADCPQLEELTISLEQGLFDNEVVFDTSSLSFPWSNISKLTVTFGIHLSDNVCSLLILCPNLRELSAHCLSYEDSEESDDLPLEPLQLHSGITSLTITYPIDLLKRTDYPALTHLSLKSTSPNQTLPFLSRYHHRITHFEVVLDNGLVDAPSDWGPVLHFLPDVVHFTVHLRGVEQQPAWEILAASLETQLPLLQTLVVHTECHLMTFCDEWDIVPLVEYRWSECKLEILEIHTVRIMDRSNLELIQNIWEISERIGTSDAIEALLDLKAIGLQININDIPLTGRTALLYM